MKTDINGCSTCPKGQEHYEEFSIRGRTYVQYDYRDSAGELFSTVAASVEIARKRRDEWMAKNN